AVRRLLRPAGVHHTRARDLRPEVRSADGAGVLLPEARRAAAHPIRAAAAVGAAGCHRRRHPGDDAPVHRRSRRGDPPPPGVLAVDAQSLAHAPARRPRRRAGAGRAAPRRAGGVPAMSRAAIFLDRDGTICEEVGYVNHLSRSRLLPGSLEAIRLVNQAGLLAVVTTNQSGVARGYFSEDLVEAVHAQLLSAVSSGGARLDAIY